MEDDPGVRDDPLTVAARVRAAMGDLSAAERKVARALLSAYPVAGLETVAELAARAGVSPPTVVRFVARIGFGGYADLQKALMAEVHAQMGSPVQQYAMERDVPEGADFLPFINSAFSTLVQRSFADLPESEFNRAVQLLGDHARRIHVVGGRFSHHLAAYFAAHLQLLRPGVATVPPDEFSRVSLAAAAGRADVLVAFDFRRYDPATVRLAEASATAGASTVLFTDPWLSPIADIADVVLPTRVESPSPFDSLIPAFALVEAMVAALTEQLGEAGRQRVERLEGIRATLDPHTPSALPPQEGPRRQV